MTVQVKVNAVTDDAGNSNTVSAATSNIHIDTIAPTATISGLSTGDQKDAFPLTITFNEDVTGFAKEDLTVTGQATATAVSGGPKVYTATITPNANKEGNVTVKVKADAVTDAAGNTSAQSDTYTIRVDTLPPEVESITGEPITEQNGPFDLTVTFSEPVFDFEAGYANDVRWGTFTPELGTPEPNSSAVLFQFELRQGADGDSVYQVRITPMSGIEGKIRFAILAQSSGGSFPSDGVSDAAGNIGNGLEGSDRVHVDTIVPTATISGLPTGEENDAFPLTITFNEDVSGFATADLMVNGEATATAVAAVSGSESEYTATITPNADSEGDVTVTVNANAVTDDAGNNNPVSAASDPVHIDTRPPVITMEIYNSAGNELVTGDPYPTLTVATGRSNFIVYVTASENVTGFSASEDFMLSPSELARFNQVSRFSGPTVWGVRITRKTKQEGLVNFFLKAVL